MPADALAAGRLVPFLEGGRVLRRIPRWARPEEVEAALDEAVNEGVSRERRRERWNSIRSSSSCTS